jgi:hypothetical protein
LHILVAIRVNDTQRALRVSNAFEPRVRKFSSHTERSVIEVVSGFVNPTRERGFTLTLARASG